MNAAPAVAAPSATTAGAAGIVPGGGRAAWLRITLARQMLNAAAQRFWTHPEAARLFLPYMVETYTMVHCALRAMREAYDLSAELALADPVAAILAPYLRRHMDEERHHDDWLLDDLVVAGLDRASIAGRYPGAQVAQLVGAQFLWIRHAHPVALFGFLGVLEDPPTMQHVDELERLTGLPTDAFRCLRLHVTHDVDHSRELREVVESLPLTQAQADLIATSAFSTLQCIAALMEELERGVR